MTTLLLICLSIVSMCLVEGLSFSDYDFTELTQNNTGPVNRSRPVLTCYPALEEEGESFNKCILAGGIEFDAFSNIVNLFCDVWQMDIDMGTKSVAWTLLQDNMPSVACGGFHQFWKHNLTAVSWTAGLNSGNVPNLQCEGNQIVTYDYKWRNYKIETVNGIAWGDTIAGGCDNLGDNVFCFGGFSCSTFQDNNRLTKYNKITKTVETVLPVGIDQVLPRHHASVNCYQTLGFCTIGSGDLLSGGTVDQWIKYVPNWNFIIPPQTTNTPQNLQYLSADIAQEWVIQHGKYTVKREKFIMPIVGGDNATGISGSSDTIRYVGIYNPLTRQFATKQAPLLYSIKQEYLANIPKKRDQGQHIAHNFRDSFIEYGGSQSDAANPFNYPNKVVLHDFVLPY